MNISAVYYNPRSTLIYDLPDDIEGGSIVGASLVPVVVVPSTNEAKLQALLHSFVALERLGKYE